MQEIKIPDGCKASIDFEKRVVVIEKGEFKKGDIVFASDHNNLNKVIFIYMKYEPDPNALNGYHYYTQLNLITKDLYYTDSMSSDWVECRLATPAEQQLLFDALAKEGKKWNAETLQIEDIEKDILVPESIGIYRYNDPHEYGGGDNLFIGFNNNTQLLGYCANRWVAYPNIYNNNKKVQCKLIPCKREDLKVGDTAFIYQSCITNPNLGVVNRCYKVLPDNKYAKVNAESVLVVTIEGRYLSYKVEPINK